MSLLRTNMIKHQVTAFLPDTFRYRRTWQTYGGSAHEYTVSAYWHTFYNAHRAAFGVVSFRVDVRYAPAKPKDLTYGQVLDMCGLDGQTKIAYESRTSGTKIGNLKPYRDANVYKENPDFGPLAYEGECSMPALENMISDPEQVPDGSDGWYLFLKPRPARS